MSRILIFLALIASPLSGEVSVKDLSESLGHLIMSHLAKESEMSFDLGSVIKGMQDERAGKPTPLNEEDFQAAISEIQERLFNQFSEKNLAAAVAFLQENKAKEEVKCIDDKLQYKIVQQGKGDTCITPESNPLIHYKGSLLDGTIFVESQNDPKTIVLKETIPGFCQGIIGMKEGEKRTVYIHPDLGFGIGGQVPPNSLLIFEVELIKVS